MSIKKIIPCLDVRNGSVVKGVNFEGIKEIENPVNLARFYNNGGADELVFYDITASIEGRSIFYNLLAELSENITIPFTVGGGIVTLNDIEKALSYGADKVSINSGAIKNPKFLNEASQAFGSNRIVFAMDVKRVGSNYNVFKAGGRQDTNINAIEWAKIGQGYGVGEIVINSIDTDGVKKGFDIEMLNAISSQISVPIVASGGAGAVEDFIDLFTKLPKIDAGLAASVFHFKEIAISDLKNKLRSKNINVNI